MLEGRYRFGPVERFNTDDGQLELWSALDALVLKAVAIVLSRRLTLPDRCFHVVGHGGAKAAVRAVAGAVADHQFVYRSDVKS